MVFDYKGYKGVNRAQSVGECCQLLVQESYATDPHYASKLMSIINRQTPGLSSFKGSDTASTEVTDDLQQAFG